MGTSGKGVGEGSPLRKASLKRLQEKKKNREEGGGGE